MKNTFQQKSGQKSQLFCKTYVDKFMKSCSNSVIVKKQQIEDLPLSVYQPSNVNNAHNNTKWGQAYGQLGSPSTASTKVSCHKFVGSPFDNTKSQKVAN